MPAAKVWISVVRSEKFIQSESTLVQTFLSHTRALCFTEEQPVFGVSLHLAVERSCCHDGVELPLVVRDCIDYVEEHGMNVEGLYKVPGVKSKVQHLKKLYNHRETVNISDFEPTVATSLLILFLRFVFSAVLSPHHVF